MTMSFEVQAAFRLLHAEADRLLPAAGLERKVMKGQLAWMRTLLMQYGPLSPEEQALHATMLEAKRKKQAEAEDRARKFEDKKHRAKLRRVYGKEAA